MKQVIILMTDDDKGFWSIYEESGQALEHDFNSEEEAVEYSKDQKWERVDTFNCALLRNMHTINQ